MGLTYKALSGRANDKAWPEGSSGYAIVVDTEPLQILKKLSLCARLNNNV